MNQHIIQLYKMMTMVPEKSEQIFTISLYPYSMKSDIEYLIKRPGTYLSASFLHASLNVWADSLHSQRLTFFLSYFSS